MSIFGDYHVRLDPWSVEYEPELPLDVAADGIIENVVLDVELNPGEWRPVVPASARVFDTLHFVDGVRRIDARLLVHKAKQLCHGAFGCTAVGAVQVTAGETRCTDPVIERLVALGSGETLPAPVVASRDLVYRPATWPEPDVDGPLRAVQQRMRDIEETVIRRLAEDERSLVVVDGPLSYAHPVRGNVLGYIKRIVQLYLPVRYTSIVSDLPVGGRTPLFEITHMKRGRYSWFQRISAPHRGDSYLAGIVRMEVSSQIGTDAGRQLADAAAVILPKFAPPCTRDPRALRNLLPIGALESHLRRLLGDPRLTRRRIESVIADEAKHG
jgi:hypothetical protein